MCVHQLESLLKELKEKQSQFGKSSKSYRQLQLQIDDLEVQLLSMEPMQ